MNPRSRSLKKGLSQDGRVLASVLLLLVIVVAGITVVPFFLLGAVVPPDAIGIRRNYFTIPLLLKAGYQSNGLPPGLHWQLPLVSKVELLPRDFRTIVFSSDKSGGDLYFPELLVPTTDGSKVRTDVTLLVRLYERPLSTGGTVKTEEKHVGQVPVVPKVERPHGGPQELIERYATNIDFALEKFAQRAENELRQALSELSTADYYNPVLREKAAVLAQQRISEQFEPEGIELWGTLIRRYTYADQSIDDQIFAKNLQDQTERYNAASSRLAGAKAETERQRALWDAKIKNLEVEGQSKQLVLESQGKLYEAKKNAEGDFLVAKAKAEVDGARATVLSEGAGSEIYVARELVPLISALRGGVVSNVDPFDIDKWADRFIGARGRLNSQ